MQHNTWDVSMAVNALLVEDDLDLADATISYLALENIECDYAANGRIGLNLALENPYQVIVLDVAMPIMNGFQVCTELRAKGCDTPILMLTAKDTITDKLEGFDAGADDYLVKPFDLDELVARITALSKRRSVQSQLLTLDDLVLDVTKHTVTRAGEAIELSPIGWKILEFLMRESPKVVTKEALIEEIWGEESPDSSSLKVHLFRLRQKVDKPFGKALIQTIHNHGVVIRETDED